tara:strand:+ start:161 stop:292 length:132 start_codon:yes stop_codon:yes gene_type:complete
MITLRIEQLKEIIKRFEDSENKQNILTEEINTFSNNESLRIIK